jgi:hypothetical protein
MLVVIVVRVIVHVVFVIYFNASVLIRQLDELFRGVCQNTAAFEARADTHSFSELAIFRNRCHTAKDRRERVPVDDIPNRIQFLVCWFIGRCGLFRADRDLDAFTCVDR